MGRLRKDKPGAPKPKGNGGNILKKQIVALGGTAADFELVKNADNRVESSNDADPSLSKDVSNFLKGLNLPSGSDVIETNEKTKKKGSKSHNPTSIKEPVAQTTLKGKGKGKGLPTVELLRNVDNSAKSKQRMDGATLAPIAEQTPKQKKGKTKAELEPAEDSRQPKLPRGDSKGKSSKKSKEGGTVPKPTEVKGKSAINVTDRPAEPKASLPVDPKLNSKLVFPPTSQWYSALPPPPAAPATTVSSSMLEQLVKRATSLHTTDIINFQASSSSTSEASFFAKMSQSGTLSDRLSALTLLVQSSPVHNTKALDTLKGMAERGKGKGGREESLKALRCIVDWWIGGGAPERKLKYFRDQPLYNESASDAHLVAWHFEDWLKKYFFSILQILETLSLDPLPYVRQQALTLLFNLLRDKPEQEQNLLRLLVNKLGDTDKPICSRASHYILALLQSHPSMKAVVVREITALILRPAASTAAAAISALVTTTTPADVANRRIKFSDATAAPTLASSSKSAAAKPTAPIPANNVNVHARYYALITFNQIVLTPTPQDRDVSFKLIDVYFELFRELLGEGDLGLDRDGLGPDDHAEEDVEVKTDKQGRVVSTGDSKKGKRRPNDKAPSRGKGKGKSKERIGDAGFTEVEDAKSKLISAILTGINRALPFAKVGKDQGKAGESSEASLLKHIDTLFLITHTSTFNVTIQALVLIQHISGTLISSAPSASTTKSLTDRYYRTLYSSLSDQRLATSSKQAMYLNLLFKSIKADVSHTDRVKALVRRFVQILVAGGNGATEFVAGGLFVLGELLSSIPGLRAMVTERSNPSLEDSERYDPQKRDPQYAHASGSPLWELTILLNHYHPAIALHAKQILSSQPLTATPDLSLNTLSHFLDRFVYKNPKKQSADESTSNAKAKGGSAMQPAATGVDGTGVKLMKGEVSHGAGMVNEQAFLRRKEQDVPVDQLFYHKFFSRKSEREKARNAKNGKVSQQDAGDEDDGDEDDGDEDDEDEVHEDVDVGLGPANSDVSGDEDSDDSDEEMDLTGDEDQKAQTGALVEDEDDEEDSDGDEDEVWKAMKASMPQGPEEDDFLDGSDDDSAQSLGDDASDDGFAEDSEDLMSDDGSDSDSGPDGLIEFDGSDEGGNEEDGWGGIGNDKKRKRDGDEEAGKPKKKKLPTFASYEDYAKMIDEGPEDDI